MRYDNDMTAGVIWKKLLRFFLPVAAGTLLQQFYNAADAVIVGRFLGTEALAAVGGSASAVSGLTVWVFVNLALGCTVVISQFYGAGDEDSLSRATGTSVALCLILGIALALISVPSAPFLLRLLSTPEDTVSDAATYLRIYLSAIPVMLLANVESGILRAVGDSRSPFLYMLVSCAVNILLDLLLVGVFHCGVAGAAWATVAAQVINVLMATLRLSRTDAPYRIRISMIRFDRPILRSMLAIGVPSALQAFMYTASNMLLQSTVNTFGTVFVASWSLADKLYIVYTAVASGMGAAAATFAGQNWGAGQKKRIREGVRTGFFLFIPALVIIGAAVLLVAPGLLTIFSDDPAVRSTCYAILLFFIPFFPASSVTELVSSTMRGCGNVRTPMIITLMGVCVFRIIWIFTACRLWHTLPVVSLSYGLSYLLTAIAMVIYFLRWKKRSLAEL